MVVVATFMTVMAVMTVIFMVIASAAMMAIAMVTIVSTATVVTVASVWGMRAGARVWLRVGVSVSVTIVSGTGVLFHWELLECDFFFSLFVVLVLCIFCDGLTSITPSFLLIGRRPE